MMVAFKIMGPSTGFRAEPYVKIRRNGTIYLNASMIAKHCANATHVNMTAFGEKKKINTLMLTPTTKPYSEGPPWSYRLRLTKSEHPGGSVEARQLVKYCDFPFGTPRRFDNPWNKFYNSIILHFDSTQENGYANQRTE